MAFVHRTTRTNNRVGFVRAATHSTVGPGSYEMEGAIKQERPSYAPFGSTNQRIGPGAPGTAKPEMITPGPGSYVEPTPQRRRAAASDTFKSTTKRFQPKKTMFTPGPGAYEEKRTGFANKSKRSGAVGSQSAPMQSSLRQESGPSVKWVRVPTAPSIPATNQAFGYEEGHHGELVQQKPMNVGYSGRSGDAVGPGDYNPNTDFRGGGPQKTVRGTDFGRTQTKRVDAAKLTGFGNPGPGRYDATVEVKSSLLPPKQSSVFESRTQRGNQRKVLKEDNPGPGHYANFSTFGNQTKEEHLQFFGSTSRRFDAGPRTQQRTYGGPGPGAYKNAAPSAFKGRREQARRRGGSKYARGGISSGLGFHSTASRWRGSEPRADAPKTGPGRYEAKGLAEELASKVTSRAGAFGCSTKRFHKLRSPAADNPGPGWYKSSEVEGSAPGGVDPPAFVDRTTTPAMPQAHAVQQQQAMQHASASYSGSGSGGASAGAGSLAGSQPRAFPVKNPAVAAKRTANFESTSDRPSNAPKYLAEVPPPGTYNIGVKWTTGSGHGLMGSGGQRFKEPSAKSATSEKPPGPGRYEAKSSMRDPGENRKDILLSSAPRFQAAASRLGPGLGPGSYDPEFLYGNLNKPTFNMSIADASAQ